MDLFNKLFKHCPCGRSLSQFEQLVIPMKVREQVPKDRHHLLEVIGLARRCNGLVIRLDHGNRAIIDDDGLEKERSDCWISEEVIGLTWQ